MTIVSLKGLKCMKFQYSDTNCSSMRVCQNVVYYDSRKNEWQSNAGLLLLSSSTTLGNLKTFSTCMIYLPGTLLYVKQSIASGTISLQQLSINEVSDVQATFCKLSAHKWRNGYILNRGKCLI